MTDEEKEIFNNLKEYMQNQIDNGYHKFIYNDLDWDFKCVDCINAIEHVLELIEKQQKEIEKLKAINKMQKYRIEVIDEREFISKDKIKAKVIEIKNRPVKDEFITATQGKLNTIIDIESLLD